MFLVGQFTRLPTYQFHLTPYVPVCRVLEHAGVLLGDAHRGDRRRPPAGQDASRPFARGSYPGRCSPTVQVQLLGSDDVRDEADEWRLPRHPC